MQPTMKSSKPPRPPSAAERWYQLGSDLARIGRYQEALKPLEQAMAYSVEEPNAPFLRSLRSYYGLTVAFARADFEQGRLICEQAMLNGPPIPQLYVNLAQVYVRVNRKDLAVKTLQAALALDHGQENARTLLFQLGTRKPPVFTFLSRGHLINRFAGKLRHRLAG